MEEKRASPLVVAHAFFEAATERAATERAPAFWWAVGEAPATGGWGWEAVGCRARRRMGAVTRSIDSHRARYVIQQNPQQSHGLCTRY